jgi:uncharacterized membrane protein
MGFAVTGNLQMSGWHGGVLFMGMHWLWWLAWILTIAGALWAFTRVRGDRAQTRRRLEAEDAAAEVLRRRFAEGDIDEEEFIRRMKALRETIVGE